MLLYFYSLKSEVINVRIAFLVKDFPFSSQTFILNQITGLIDHGHDLRILANSYKTSSKVAAELEKYQLDQLTYYTLYEKMPGRMITRWLKGLFLMLIHYRHFPLLYRSLDVSKYGNFASSLMLFYLVVALLDTKPFDIIYCHFGWFGKYGAYLRDIGVLQGKVVTVFHGADITRDINNQGKDTYDKLFEMGNLFLPISDLWKEKLIEVGCDARKICVHRMGINLDQFQFKPRQLDNNGKVRLITVCRLAEKKGVEYSIRAVSEVSKRYQNLEYLIVGDGPLRPPLEKLIQELNPEANIQILGWKKHEDVTRLLSDAHILIAPSVTAADGDQEGIPVALMEAMAMGLPVVSTYHSGIPELVENGISGYLVSEKDVNSLANKLEQLILQPETWLDLGQAGRDRVEKSYNIKKLNSQLTQIFQDLLID